MPILTGTWGSIMVALKEACAEFCVSLFPIAMLAAITPSASDTCDAV